MSDTPREVSQDGSFQPLPLSESEVKKLRYQRVEREADAFGRIIGVRRLKPSEQTKVTGMTPELSGADTVRRRPPPTPETDGALWKDAEEEFINVSHRMPLMIAAAVCEVDGNPILFPKSRTELDSLYDRLDMEGIAAAGAAIARLVADELPFEGKTDAAKNSSGTRSSD